METNRVERAKEAGWRIECLGDQQDGLFNYVIWSPDNGYSIQTEYPLGNEDEAWEYFYGFILGLPGESSELAPAPAVASAAADVSMPLDGETFDEWVARVGKSVEDTAFYWKQIAADNLELAADNADELDSVKAALKPFADDYADWVARDDDQDFMQFLEATRDAENMAVSAAIAHNLVYGQQASGPPADGEWDNEHGGDYDDGESEGGG